MLKLVSACAIAGACSSAQATLVTFEGHPTSGLPVETSEGFTFTFNAAGWAIAADGFNPGGIPFTHNGTTRLLLAGSRGSSFAQVRVSQTHGNPFSLQGVDAATMFEDFVGSISVTGSILGGGTISQVIGVDETFDPYTFSGFDNLTSVVFAETVVGTYERTPGLSLDNLRVNEPSGRVPEPGSLALVGIAAFAAACAGRRRLSS